MGENMTQHDHVGRHADRDRSEQPAVTTPDDERVQRYAEALRDCIKARTVPPVIGTGGGLSLGATEWDMARAVIAVADAEHAHIAEAAERALADERDNVAQLRTAAEAALTCTMAAAARAALSAALAGSEPKATEG